MRSHITKQVPLLRSIRRQYQSLFIHSFSLHTDLNCCPHFVRSIAEKPLLTTTDVHLNGLKCAANVFPLKAFRDILHLFVFSVHSPNYSRLEI